MMLAAFGDAGHAFPAIALGRELVRRGHEVCLETWVRWREHVEREGMRFAPAPEYEVFPRAGSAVKPYQAAVHGARDTLPAIRSFDPDVVVADILTVAAALAAEMDGRPWATLVPHVLPTPHPGFPAYAIGARLPRTAAGRAFWRLLDPIVRIGARQGRDLVRLVDSSVMPGLVALDLASNPLGDNGATVLADSPHAAGLVDLGLCETGTGNVELTALASSGHLPSLVLWGPPGSGKTTLAAILAEATGARFVSLSAVTAGVADLRRVVAEAARARRAGRRTLVRGLAAGVPVVACPAGGDMAENASRVAWAGVGVSLPRRLVNARGIRLAVERELADPAYAQRAGELGDWAARNDGAARAAEAVEAFAARTGRA